MTNCNWPALPDNVTAESTFHKIGSLREKGINEIIHNGIMKLDKLPSYEDFFLHFLLPNKPCILNSASTINWQSCKDWVCRDGKPNFIFLLEHFGEAVVPVADCTQQLFCAHPKQEMLLKDFLQYWIKRDSGSGDEKCLYLKDWHFTRSFPEYVAYETPVYFQSDWLNEFWDFQADKSDDYKFVYMGPKNSWTPLHADVMRSYSWSANICGRKKWVFFPPGEEEVLKDKFGQLVFDVTSSELEDESKYPNSGKPQHKFELIQEAGEIIFVPSGWHHQVQNLEDTISINHNWLNGCNIDICWQFIKQSLADVKKEIADCQSMEKWHQQCQLILKASLGTNYVDFYKLLLSVAQHRLKSLDCQNNCVLENQQSKEGDIVFNTENPCPVAVRDVSVKSSNNESFTEVTSSHSPFSFNKSPLKYEKDECVHENSKTDKLSENCIQHTSNSCTAEIDNHDLNKQSQLKSSFEIPTSKNRRPMNNSKCLDLTEGLSSEQEVTKLLHNRKHYLHWRFCEKKQVLFDLSRVKDIVMQMIENEDWMETDTSFLDVQPETLLDEITATLTKFA